MPFLFVHCNLLRVEVRNKKQMMDEKKKTNLDIFRFEIKSDIKDTQLLN